MIKEDGDFLRNGYQWLRGALSADQVQALMSHFTSGIGRPAGGASDAAALTNVTAAVRQIFPYVMPRRILSFDKSAASAARNWAVPWHQDRVIAVRARAEAPGVRNWSRKQGIWHCEPQAEILRQMMFVRVHLDGERPETGGMQIAIGSHRRGVIATADAAKTAGALDAMECDAASGDILILQMLTLHRSPPSTRPAPRRTLRVDYAPAALALPPPLAWAM